MPLNNLAVAAGSISETLEVYKQLEEASVTSKITNQNLENALDAKDNENIAETIVDNFKKGNKSFSRKEIKSFELSLKIEVQKFDSLKNELKARKEAIKKRKEENEKRGFLGGLMTGLGVCTGFASSGLMTGILSGIGMGFGFGIAIVGIGLLAASLMGDLGLGGNDDTNLEKTEQLIIQQESYIQEQTIILEEIKTHSGETSKKDAVSAPNSKPSETKITEAVSFTEETKVTESQDSAEVSNQTTDKQPQRNGFVPEFDLDLEVVGKQEARAEIYYSSVLEKQSIQEKENAYEEIFQIMNSLQKVVENNFDPSNKESNKKLEDMDPETHKLLSTKYAKFNFYDISLPNHYNTWLTFLAVLQRLEQDLDQNLSKEHEAQVQEKLENTKETNVISFSSIQRTTNLGINKQVETPNMQKLAA